MMSADNMKAAKIVNYLVSRGHTIDFVRDNISINPKPERKLIDRVLANEKILVSLLRSLGGRPPTNHPFVVSESHFVGLPDDDCGLCIACGIPWLCHGEPPLASWFTISDANIDRVAKRADCVPLPVSNPEFIVISESEAIAS